MWKTTDLNKPDVIPAGPQKTIERLPIISAFHAQWNQAGFHLNNIKQVHPAKIGRKLLKKWDLWINYLESTMYEGAPYRNPFVLNQLRPDGGVGSFRVSAE